MPCWLSMNPIRHLASTDIVAWWGAIVATIVLIWDIYKWKTAGPQIKFSVSPNRRIANNPQFEGSIYIICEAVNIGDRATTLTNLELSYYKKRLLGKPKFYAIPNPKISKPLPYELQPGTVWQGVILQEEQIEQMARDGYLYAMLSCAHTSKPKMTRIAIESRPPKLVQLNGGNDER